MLIERPMMIADLPSVPSGKYLLFLDAADMEYKLKFSDGSIKVIGTSPNVFSIKYYWYDQESQDAQRGMNVLDKGVRIDLVGRPVFEWGGDAWVYKYSLSADASRSRYDNPSHPELNTIAQALDKLLFVPLGPGIQDPYRAYDSGVVIPDVSAEWSYNKEIQQQFFEGEELPLDARGYVVTGANLRDDKTYRLSVLSGGLISVFPLVCRFLPRVYYGGHAPTELPWDSILTDLSSTEPTDVVQRVLSVRMKKNECGYLALPYRLCMSSAPRVTVDGVSGGYMELGAFPLKNRFNHTEYFYLYRTIQCGLGEVEVAIR